MTFAIGVTFSALLAARGGDDLIVGGFLGFVAAMQGLEFLLWRNQLCTETNATLSKTAMVFNHAQPLVLGALALWLGRPAARITIAILLIAYSIVAAIYSKRWLDQSTYPCTKRAEGDPHLLWSWGLAPQGKVMYGLFLALLALIPALAFKDRRYGFAMGALGPVLFATSAVLYDRQYMGAMWCFYAALAPLGVYLWRS